jgi:hypothetical protein
MFEKISLLIKTLKGFGYHPKSQLIISLASIFYPNQDDIIKILKSKFNLDDSKSNKISKFLSIKNMSIIKPEDYNNESRKNEAETAKMMSQAFLRNNSNLKQELEEADRIWNSWKESGPPKISDDYSGGTEYSGDFVNQSDPGEVYPDLSGARPGFNFSIPNEPLNSDKQPKNFYYLYPFDENGELMSVDDFFSFYIKKGIVPITSTGHGSIFYEQFLNTAEDIYNMDEVAVNEQIGLMKMEDSMHEKSRIFEDLSNNYDADPYNFDDDSEYEEHKSLIKAKKDKDKILSMIGNFSKNLLNSNVQGKISDIAGNGDISSGQRSEVGANKSSLADRDAIHKEIASILAPESIDDNEYVKSHLEDIDAYNIISSKPNEFLSLIKADKKGWEMIAENIANNNPTLFIGLRLYRIYTPEEYSFSEKCLEKTTKKDLLGKMFGKKYNQRGIDLFYSAKLWKEVPPHFIELVADVDPKRFFETDELVEMASEKAVAIASKAYLETTDYKAFDWFKFNKKFKILERISKVSEKVARSQFDRASTNLADEDPARFLAFVVKDGKRLSDYNPHLKDIALENMINMAVNLPYEDPITFFSPIFPGSKKLWADYYDMELSSDNETQYEERTREEGISIAIETALKLLNKEEMAFSVEWLKAGLHRFTLLENVTDLVVKNIINKCLSIKDEDGELLDYKPMLDEPEDIANIKAYFNNAAKNPDNVYKVNFDGYSDKSSYPTIISAVNEYLSNHY